MKRYLIYGFLTILIITLNFAFIIVLATDNVRINYRVLFLLWVVVILAAAGLAYLEKTKKKKESAASAAATASDRKNSPRSHEGSSGNLSNLYKNKCIKKFRILLADDLTNKIEPGFFGGYVTNEDYSNETVQAVYTDSDQLLGYINNKKKKKLCENIEILYNEPLVCWGEIKWDDNEKRYCVKGYIPILYSEPEINRFKKMVRLKEELLQLEATPEMTDNYRYLEKIENFFYLQQSEITPSSLDHPVQPYILPKISKDLLEKEEWKELVKLKKYPILISRMDQPEKKEVLSRIKKGEKKMTA